MDQFTKEGRKLRPRKTAQSGSSFEKVEFSSGERRPRQYGEGRSSYGEHRSHGEGRRSYGENRSYGEGGERRTYGAKRQGQKGKFGPKFNKKKCVLSMVFGIIGIYLMISMFMSIPLAKMMIENMMRDMDQGSNTVVYVADAGPASAVIVFGGVVALAFAVVSIIMGALGLVDAIKAMKNGEKAVPGIVMAAIGLALSLVAVILFFVLCGEAAAFKAYLGNLRY